MTVPFEDGPDDMVVIHAIRYDGQRSSSGFVGLAVETGIEQWRADQRHGTGSMQGFGTTLLDLAPEGFTAFDARSGEILWSTEVPPEAGKRPLRRETAPTYTPQRWGDDVIIGTDDGVAILDLATGEMAETPVPGDSSMTLTVSDSTLTVLVGDGDEERQMFVFSRDD